MRRSLLLVPALLLLAGCGASAEDIAKAISSANPVMREDGAKIAQNYDDPAVVDALIAVLADPSEKVRLNAIESLAELEATSAATPLIARLHGDPSPRVKRAAADALGRLQIKEAVPELVAYVQSFRADDREQLAGIWAIGNIGSTALPADIKATALDCLVSLRDRAQDRYVLWSITMALRTLK